MSETLRSELKACAVKIETVAGTDVLGAGPPASTDYIAADWTIALPQDASDNPEQNGALDVAAAIAGGIRPTVTISMPLRGAGVAATSPEWGKLMRCCSYTETVTAVAVGVPTACLTGGSATTVPLAATPFGNTAQQYRGMPLALTGDIVRTSLIQDYSATRVASLIETLSGTPTVSTLAMIPANVLYSPTSDESLWKTCTIWLYQDGIRFKMTGCSGTWSLDLTAGKIGMLTFEMRGILTEAFAPVAFPTGWNAGNVRKTPPLWINGRSQLARALARTDKMKITAGLSLTDPENPEAAQGFDLPVPTARQTTIEISPFSTTTLSPTRFSNFQAGTSMPYGAMLGSDVGNRIGVTVPNGRVTRHDLSDRNKLGVDNITMMVDGADLGPTLCVY